MFRDRFRRIGRFLKLPVDAKARGCIGSRKPILDLGSLRGGGATALYVATEDEPKVQGRGRWLSRRSMMIYLQELLATTFMSTLPDEVKVGVFGFADAVAEVVDIVFGLFAKKIHADKWSLHFENYFRAHARSQQVLNG